MFSLCLTLTTIALFCSVVHHRLLSEQPVGDNPDERKGGEFGTTTGSSVALRLAGDPPYTLLDADDRLLHAQPRQARCASSVRCRKKPGTVQYSQARYMTVTA